MDIGLNEVLVWVRLASTSIVAMLLLTVGAAPLVAAACQHLAKVRERIFYDKFAKQIAQMGLVLGLCTLPFTAGVWAVLYMQHPVASIPALSHPLLAPPALLPFGLYILGLALCAIHAANWSRWKGRRFLQSLFAWGGWLALTTAGVGLLTLKRTMNAYPDAFAVDPSLSSYVSAIRTIPLLSSLWPFLGMAVFGGLAGAGTLGAVYCLSRRDKEDYGRDYYAFALKAASWWGAFGSALAGAAAGGYMVLVHARFPDAWQALPAQSGLAAAGIMLLLALCLLSVAGSATPLRRKSTTYLGALLLLTAALAMGYPVMYLYTLF